MQKSKKARHHSARRYTGKSNKALTIDELNDEHPAPEHEPIPQQPQLAVYNGPELLAVTVYRKGAEAIINLFNDIISNHTHTTTMGKDNKNTKTAKKDTTAAATPKNVLVLDTTFGRKVRATLQYTQTRICRATKGAWKQDAYYGRPLNELVEKGAFKLANKRAKELFDEIYANVDPEAAAAVYDGDTCITPETITEYARDAEGRATATTTRAGALTTVSRTAYDALGRIVSQTDALGRTTTTAYSADGLTTTQTTPSGATLVTTRNTDGSTARVSGTGQRELTYAYDVSEGRMRTTVRLADDSILSQTLENGFGETVVEAEASTTRFIYTRSEYNNRGLLTRSYKDTGAGTTPTASTLYEYDSFGNVTRQVLALAAEPSPLNSPVEEFAYGVEEGTDGVYSSTSRTSYNAAGTALTSTRKELLSNLSSTLAENRLPSMPLMVASCQNA